MNLYCGQIEVMFVLGWVQITPKVLVASSAYRRIDRTVQLLVGTTLRRLRSMRVRKVTCSWGGGCMLLGDGADSQSMDLHFCQSYTHLLWKMGKERENSYWKIKRSFKERDTQTHGNLRYFDDHRCLSWSEEGKCMWTYDTMCSHTFTLLWSRNVKMEDR